MAVRFAAVAGLGALATGYGVLVSKLGADGAAAHGAFHAAYVLALLALLHLALRKRPWVHALSRTIRKCPVRSGLLIVNLAFAALLVLNTLTEWGAIGILGLASVGLIALGTRTAAGSDRLLMALVQRSPLSFGVLYLLVAGGEVYFHYHPEQVGGGGGGNPALREVYRGLYSANSFGLRGEACDLEPASGTFRILALGDSFTFGQGVESDHVYPVQLQRLLSARHGGPAVEVLNAGHAGADMAWELDYLKREGLRFRPNLVLLQFYVNDVRAAAPPTVARRQRLLELLVRRPLQRSYLVFALRYRFEAVLKRQRMASHPNVAWDFREAIARLVLLDAQAWREWCAALDEMASVTDEAGASLMVALFPHPGQSHEATAVVHAAVAEHCASLGVPTLDLEPALVNIEPDDQIVSSFDHHPSAAYHRAAAEALARELTGRGLIPRQ